MSENITIQEGGASRAFTAKKLKTNLAGGDSCLWVPSSTVELGTKIIDDNGEYAAKEDGKYAFSSVTVSRYVNQVVGKRSDGNIYSVRRNDAGALVEEVLPVEIRVTTPPAKVKYYDGETIDYSGMVVTAYKADGEVWTNEDYPDGVIPLSEVTISPVVATDSTPTIKTSYIDGVMAKFAETNSFMLIGDNPPYSDASPDSLKEYIYIIKSITITDNRKPVYCFPYETPFMRNGVNVGFMSKDAFKAYYFVADATPDGRIIMDNDYKDGASVYNAGPYMENGENIFLFFSSRISLGTASSWNYQYFRDFDRNPIGVSVNDLTSLDLSYFDATAYDRSLKDHVYWSLLYGDNSMLGQDSINISWHRPEDHKLLETSFDITVSQND